MNQQPNNVSRILIVAAVLLLVFIAAYFMTVQPKLTQVAASRQQLDTLQLQYAQLKQVADQKPLYLALIKQIQGRLTGVELTADPRTYIPSYLKQIEALATRDGLVVTSIVPAPEATPTPSGSPSPGAVPTGAAALQNVPVVGAPLRSAGRALGASNAQAQAENGQMPGASPAPALPGATPIPAASAARAVPATATTSPQENAIVYLNEQFQTVHVDMEMSGTFADLRRFLRDLNKFPKLVGVGNVTLTAQQAPVGETPKLHIVLPINLYRLSAGSVGPSPTPAPDGGTISQ